MSRMTPIGGEPDPRGIDRNDKQAMADYRRRLADFKKREREYNRASPEEQDRIRQRLKEEREQRRKDNPPRPRGEGRKPIRGGRRGVKTGGRRGIPYGCPDPSMLILMADGSQKKAGDLKVGDLVKTYDEKDLEKAKKLVRNKSLVLSTGGSEKLSEFREQLENSYVKASLGEYKVEFIDIIKNVEKIKFTFEGSEIICSSTHKFYVNNAWKEAKNMVIGDKVSGKKLLSTEDVENGDVVHITVEDAHTYICEGLLSHNKRRLPDRGEGGGRGVKPGGRRRRRKGTPPRDVPRPIRDGRSCPDPSMLILMADGSQKKAGDLAVGDLVKTYHEKDLEKASKKSLVLASGGTEKHSQLRDQLESSYAKATLGEYEVKFVDIVKDVEKIKLTFEGSEIICSLTHKFYVNNLWKEAQDMVIGDEVSDKKLVAIEDVENGDVVHITIEDAHTYICEGLLSHNKSIRRDPIDPRKTTPPTPKRPERPQRPQEEEEDRGFGGRRDRRRRRVRDRRDRRARLRRRRQALRRARRRRRRINRGRFGRRRFGGRRGFGRRRRRRRR